MQGVGEAVPRMTTQRPRHKLQSGKVTGDVRSLSGCVKEDRRQKLALAF